ncbi:amidohydrolase [Sphingomonas sp. ID1715]|uniref:amidohydrolase n=1 Tax=Sphingomonas sp. ID1715 TaxID=1656898 RepID=UPI00148A0C27|nr:amidohydrolase [Sphingomonas sp. ID1715]NNM76209.1 amidohydrolase [Sphingomonas sp. ID1715]
MRALTLLPLLFAAPAFAQADVRADVAKDLPSLMTIYRDLHANPELSGQEKRSAAILAAEAKKAGYEVTTGVGGTGVVAVLKNGPGPVVMLRADMDALPVAEQTGLAFASKVKATGMDGQPTPVMHACGHDTHMSAWIGTARRMAALKGSWSGTLVMIGQPAEEVNGGASAMLKDGLFTRFPKPQFVIGFHDSASLPAGTVGFTPGYAMASVDSVDILVKGVGGHGAAPATTKDPIVLAARIVTSLQTLAAREIDPQDAVVVTVGSIHGGTKHNIIPSEVKLQLTVRSYSKETRQHLLDGIRRIARGEAIAAGLPDELMPVVSPFGTPGIATFNDEQLTNRLAGAWKARFGAERVEQTKPVMVSEDFPEYREADPKTIQSTLFWVGGVPREKWDAVGGDPAKLPSLHSGFWAPDAEAVIATGTEAMVTAALEVLGKK